MNKIKILTWLKWIVAIYIVALGGWLWQNRILLSSPDQKQEAEILKPRGTEVVRGGGEVESLQMSQPYWAKAIDHASRAEELCEADLGVLIQRKETLKELMVSQPRKALEMRISWAQYQTLPANLKQYFEEPINTIGQLSLKSGACAGGENSDNFNGLGNWQVSLNGKSYPALVYGTRLQHLTKIDAPIAGFTLDGQALIADERFEILSEVDAQSLAHLPLGAPQLKVDPMTGERLGRQFVTALSGGKRYLFNSSGSIEQLNQKISELDKQLGPKNGAKIVLESLAGAAAEEAMDWAILNDRSTRISYAWTTTTKKFILIRAQFTDRTYTDAPNERLNKEEFLNGEVSNGFYQFSNGKMSLESVVSDWIMLNNFDDYANFDAQRDAALDAYKAIHGANSLDEYDFVGVAFPTSAHNGLLSGDVGGYLTHYDWAQTSFYGFVHEIGHNLGLGHAQLWVTSDNSVVGAGTSLDYGHGWDIMGAQGRSITNHYHVQAKARLNWLDAGTNWLDLDTSGSGVHRVYRFDHPATATSNAVRALRITKDTGEYYWMGYRRAATENPWLRHGIELLWQQNGDTKGHLLDTTPGSDNGRNDCAVLVGQTYSDTTAGIHITNIGEGGAGADAWIDINVQVGAFSGNTAPVISTSSLPTTAVAGQPLNFSVSATDADGDTLAYQWIWGDYEPGVNAPNASHIWNVAGTYTVMVKVSDMKGGVATASQTITVTDPAANWTELVVPNTSGLRKVIYKYGRFVAASSSGIRFSIDGQNWEESTGTSGVQAVAASTDTQTFIAVGNQGSTSQLLRSPDGKNWTRIPLPSTNPLFAVAYGSGTFVAMGDDGLVWRSTDQGLTWTRHDTPDDVPNVYHMAYGNGVFIGITFSKIWVSSDLGLTWTDRYPSSTARGTWGGIYFLNGCFYGLAQFGSSVSEDGVNWSKIDYKYQTRFNIRTAVASPTRILHIGSIREPEERENERVVLSSSGGEFFHDTGEKDIPVDLDAIYADGRFYGVQNDKAYYTGSDYPTNQAPVVSISGAVSGTPLQPITLNASISDPDGDAVTIIWDFMDGSYLQDGLSVSKTFQVGGIFHVKCIATDHKGGVTEEVHTITIDDPMSQWANSEIVAGRTMQHVNYLNGRYIASANGYMYYSVDGASWAEQNMNNGNFRGRSCVWDGTTYVMVGETWNSADWVAASWRSVDGKTWAPTTASIHADSLNDVCYRDGVFVAVGENGLVARSMDSGQTWSTSSIAGASSLLSIQVTQDGFVTIDNNQVWTSEDGISWTERTSGLQARGELKDIAANGNTVVICGSNNGLQVSNDGGLTYSRRDVFGGLDNLSKIAFGNGIYVASGTIGGTPSLVISRDGINWSKNAVSNVPANTSLVYGAGKFFGVQGSNGDTYYSDTFFPSNSTPTAAIDAPTTVNVSSAVNFVGNATDADGDALTYIWNFNDGTPLVDGASVSRVFDVGGTYNIQLTVTDKRGGVVITNHTLAVSDPLNTWTMGTVASGRLMNAVDYFNGRYIAASNGYAYFSLDGNTWTSQNMGGNFRGRAIASNGDKYVMIGSEWNGSWYGTAWSSADGKTWSLTKPNLGSELYDVTYGNGKFVGVGSSGTVAYSTDGETWNTVSIPGAANLRRVSATSSGFVAIEHYSNYWHSTDGINWVNRTSATVNAGSYLDILANGDEVYIVGDGIGIQRSTDGGLSFVRHDLIGGGNMVLDRISHRDGLYVASGKVNSVDAIVVSRDGINWFKSSVTNVPANTYMSYGDGRFFGVQGSNGASYASDSFFPNNLVPTGTLTVPTTLNARTNLQFEVTATDGDNDALTYIWDFNDGTPLVSGPQQSKVFLVGGTYQFTCYVTDSKGGVLTLNQSIVVNDPLSADQWVKRTTPTSTKSLNDIAVGKDVNNADQVLAVGDFYILASPDGENWTAIKNNDNVNNFKGVVFTGDKYLMCGENYEFNSTAWKGAITSISDVGGTNTFTIHYRSTTAANTNKFNDLCLGSTGNVVAVGDGGRISRSTDNGTTWQEVNHGLTTKQLKSVSYHSGRFMATADNVILISDDQGQTWSNQSSAFGVASGTLWLDSSAYLNDRFLIGGYLVNIRYSTDGLTTLNTSPISPGHRTLGFAYGEGIYLSVGELNSSETTPSNAISVDGVNWARQTMTAQDKRLAVTYYKGTFITVGRNLSIWQSGSVLIPNLLVEDANGTPLPDQTGTLDFGASTLNQTQSRSLVVKNDGSAPLTVSDLDVTGDFSVDDSQLPLTIAAGQSATLQMTYLATQAGSAQGSLTITHSAGGAPYLVQLTGTVNTDPVFNGLSLNVGQFASLNINHAQILAQVTDPDGQTLEVTQVAATSTAGFALTNNAGVIQYKAANSFTGSDSILVTISDGITSIQATIQITVQQDPAFLPATAVAINMQLTSTGLPKLAFSGLIGRTYGIERSENLIDWVHVGTSTTDPVSGAVEFEDTDAPEFKGFYRAVWPAAQ